MVNIFLFIMAIFNFLTPAYASFEQWVDSSLSVELPDNIEAFCFNLYDDGNNSWSIEIIGSASFSKDDSDWACDEIFSTRENPLYFKSRRPWAYVLASRTQMLKRYLRNGKYASLLLSKKGVAIGFADGDLTLL